MLMSYSRLVLVLLPFFCVGGTNPLPSTSALSPTALAAAYPEATTTPAPALRKLKLRAMLKGHDQAAYCLAFSPDGKLFATGGPGRPVKLWEVAPGKLVATLEGHAGSVWCLAFHPDGKTLVAGSGRFDKDRQRYVSGELRVWGVSRHSLKDTVAAHDGLVRALAFSPDGT